MQRSRLLVFVVTLVTLSVGTLITQQLPLLAGYQPLVSGIKQFYEVSDDGQTFVYADTVDPSSERYQLFAVTATHRRPIQLTYEPGGIDPLTFQITPDGQTLVYVAYRRATYPDSVAYIRRVPITGGAPTTIVETPYGLVSADPAYEKGFLSPDGRYALYFSYGPTATDGAFYSVPVAGGAPVRLDTPEMEGLRGYLTASPDSRWVAFSLQPYPVPFQPDLGGELPAYIVPITGGVPVEVDPQGNGVLSYQFTSDSQSLLVEVRHPTSPDTFMLYGIHTDGTGLTQIGNDSALVIPWNAPTGSMFYYQQTYLYTNSIAYNEIFKVDALGTTPQLLYRDTVSTTTTIKKITADTIILNQEHRSSEVPWAQNYLYSLAADGSSAPVRLSENVGDENRSALLKLEVTPDGQTLLYSPVAQVENPRFLYSVPLNGSAAPTLLYPTQAVNSWHISREGSRVFAIIDKVDEQEVVEIGLNASFTNSLFKTAPSTDLEMGFVTPFPSEAQAWLTLQPYNDPFSQTLYLMDSALSNVQFPSNGVLVQEAATPFTTSVTLNAASLTTITAEIQVVGGSATAGTDYTFTPQTVTFAPGETVQPVLITLLEDAQTEGDETIILEIQEVSGGATGTPIRQTVTIAEVLHHQWLPLMKHRR